MIAVHGGVSAREQPKPHGIAVKGMLSYVHLLDRNPISAGYEVSQTVARLAA